MSASLSICIPIYNFGKFISETLDSILGQDGGEEVEIVILDGASTDDTAEIVADYQRKHPNIKFVRQPQKGGIDVDMAKSVELASGDYCWLFSGDDIMLPGAVLRVLSEIQSGQDLYLCKHTEYYVYLDQSTEYPTVACEDGAVFELSDRRSRRDYFSKAVNTEAFFSFLGGIIVKRSTWNRVPLNEVFVGSCWAHVARLFALMRSGLSVKCLSGALLDRRPDNDSFGGGGMVDRYRITIDGYHKIADHFFGHGSAEAFHVRRVIRHECHPTAMQLGKFMCLINPAGENRTLMDGLMNKAYCDFSFANMRAKLAYATMSATRFRQRNPELCAYHELRLKARSRN
ncbi:glycosyltransferase family 2 protein [Methylocystis sp.]|uniref:glycosyltransferase family 2 protein n=1 Tax=Methylocystis sp. TaxID=1911079 RepID=UPI003D0B10A4